MRTGYRESENAPSQRHGAKVLMGADIGVAAPPSVAVSTETGRKEVEPLVEGGDKLGTSVRLILDDAYLDERICGGQRFEVFCTRPD